MIFWFFVGFLILFQIMTNNNDVSSTFVFPKALKMHKAKYTGK